VVGLPVAVRLANRPFTYSRIRSTLAAHAGQVRVDVECGGGMGPTLSPVSMGFTLGSMGYRLAVEADLRPHRA
jgi:hypothetical protein